MTRVQTFQTSDAAFEASFSRFLRYAQLRIEDFSKPGLDELAALRDGSPEGEIRHDEALGRHYDVMNIRAPYYTAKVLPIARRYYHDALAGDPEGGLGLVLLLNYHRADVAYAAYLLYQRGELTQRVFGRVLGDVFIDGKCCGTLRASGFTLLQITEMFDAALPHDVMDEDDYAVFRSLPDVLEIYRGTAGQTAKQATYGMSWTCNRETAEWFAGVHASRGKPPQVWSGIVCRTDVLAYLNGRNEAEIVVRPGRVSGVRLEPTIQRLAA